MDNVEVAILSKVNELAERHGFAPTDFIATLRDDDRGMTLLAYETAPNCSKDKDNRFNTMLDTIGVPENGTLVGDCDDIYSALTAAIAKTPKPRVR